MFIMYRIVVNTLCIQTASDCCGVKSSGMSLACAYYWWPHRVAFHKVLSANAVCLLVYNDAYWRLVWIFAWTCRSGSLCTDKSGLLVFNSFVCISCRSQWPRCLRRRSTAVRLLRSWVRIPPRAWMYVCCECCVLSVRGLCDELITRPEESCRMWCVVVCD